MPIEKMQDPHYGDVVAVQFKVDDPASVAELSAFVGQMLEIVDGGVNVTTTPGGAVFQVRDGAYVFKTDPDTGVIGIRSPNV